jgi:hypothetical protein
MIGILLSETAELIYTLGKFSFNSATWAYNWYYDIPEEPTIENLKIRIKKLEDLVEENIPKQNLKEN